MPEHQVATLTVLGQLQASLQQENEALSRAEQQRVFLQATMSQSVPVVDVDGSDDNDQRNNPTGATAAPKPPVAAKGGPVPGSLSDDRAKLAALSARYTDTHPEVRKLKQQIADREAKEGSAAPIP